MDLREYLFKKEISITDFATAIGYQRTYINAITKKKKLPGRKLAKLIEAATDGEVVYKLEKTKD